MDEQEFTHDDDPSEFDGYELVMPFVVCQSNGGPYDDAAFVAGGNLAAIDALLAVNRVGFGGGIGATRFEGHVNTDCLPQLDLICMKHQMVATTQKRIDEHWTAVVIERAELVDGDGGAS